jgi:hypothetical protein
MNFKSDALINKAHGDEVSEFPTELFDNVGTSSTCHVRIIIYIPIERDPAIEGP